MESKSDLFDQSFQEISTVAKLLAHPARIAIVEFLNSQNFCMTGSISDEIPLARTTVNQHLTALKEAGWVKGTIGGAKAKYCLDHEKIRRDSEQLIQFLNTLQAKQSNC